VTLAGISQAAAVSTNASKSLVRRRLRLSQASVRATTHRRGSSWKAMVASECLTIASVQVPNAASAICQHFGFYDGFDALKVK